MNALKYKLYLEDNTQGKFIMFSVTVWWLWAFSNSCCQSFDKTNHCVFEI